MAGLAAFPFEGVIADRLYGLAGGDNAIVVREKAKRIIAFRSRAILEQPEVSETLVDSVVGLFQDRPELVDQIGDSDGIANAVAEVSDASETQAPGRPLKASINEVSQAGGTRMSQPTESIQ